MPWILERPGVSNNLNNLAISKVGPPPRLAVTLAHWALLCHSAVIQPLLNPASTAHDDDAMACTNSSVRRAALLHVVRFIYQVWPNA